MRISMLKHTIILLSLSLLMIASCTSNKANKQNTQVKDSDSESKKVRDAPVTDLCNESLKTLVTNSSFKSPFKDLRVAIENQEEHTIKVRLYVRSGDGQNTENVVGWLLVDLNKRTIKDITNDQENPANITYLSKDWDNLINCNKRGKHKATINGKDVEFGNLFNETTVIKFTPSQLTNNDAPIKEFKEKLFAYEQNHRGSASFNPENLFTLINNEVFTNSDLYIDSSWLDYFIKRHAVNVLDHPDLFELAIQQEDDNAVKVLIKNGYIVSLKQLQLAKVVRGASEAYKKRNRDNKGLDEQGDPLFYDEEKSKIKEIELLLEEQYKTNTVKDKDGYVNLRKGNNVSSPVVDKINNGDKIEIIDNVGKWWLVQTKAGKQGYVFSAKVTHN